MHLEMENANFVQVVEMTPEEKFEMYMQVPHEDLVKMKIEEERILKIIEAERDEYRRQILGY